MSKIVNPGLGYVYGREVKEDSGAITTAEVSDTRQRYEVLAIGRETIGALKVISDLANDKASIEYKKHYPGFKIGDIVIIQKHAAEGDTPPDMLSQGYALFLVDRVMGTEIELKKERI